MSAHEAGEVIHRTVRDHIPRDVYDDEGAAVATRCSCGGWMGDYFADGEQGPFDDHMSVAILAALAPAFAEARAEGAKEAADRLDALYVSERAIARLAAGSQHLDHDTMRYLDGIEAAENALRDLAATHGEADS